MPPSAYCAVSVWFRLSLTPLFLLLIILPHPAGARASSPVTIPGQFQRQLRVDCAESATAAKEAFSAVLGLVWSASLSSINQQPAVPANRSQNQEPAVTVNHSRIVLTIAGLISITLLFLYLVLLNRKLKQEVDGRNLAEEALRQSQLIISANSRQLEQLSLAAATALAIRDEKIIGQTVSRAIVEHSDYGRVIISLFKDDYPFREIIGFAGIDEEVIARLRSVELPRSWYDLVFEHGIGFGQFSYYIPHTMKHILNQEATVYGSGAVSEGLNRWHPDDNLFIRMNDDEGNFIGVISVDTAKSGRRPSDETVQPLEIFSSLIAQIIVLKREHDKRTHLEKQLRHAQKVEAIGNLTGGIAHDFNNILGVIIGQAELAMADRNGSSHCREHLQEIATAAIRARDTIRQLSSFGRKSLPQAKPTVLQPIIEEALAYLRSIISPAIDIRCDLAGVDAIIFADPTQLYQIMVNLCTNAIQAMEAGGVLTVTVDHVAAFETDVTAERYPPSGMFVRLIVADTGRGIAPEVLPHIFDPYFTTKEVGQGTGIGLAVVQGLVISHNGQLFVSSDIGIGTRFTVLFPELNVPLPNWSNEMHHRGVLGSGRILFVDDEPSLPVIGKQILERFGYQVDTSTDPARALASFKRRPGYYDLVITDFTMPNMTGDTLAVEMMTIDPGLLVILCSGFTERIDEKRARALGIRAFLKKPIATQTMLRTVQELLGNERVPAGSDYGSVNRPV